MSESSEYMKQIKKRYDKIVSQRNFRLEAAKRVAARDNVKEADTYNFAVAHGLTEAIRILDGAGINKG